ncbi:hypothetical protein [Rugosimonospora acidiphila]
MGKRYRVVLRGDGVVRAWPAQTRAQALARFAERVEAGEFSPWDGQRLMVVSEEEWARLGGPEVAVDAGADELVGASSGRGSEGSGGARRGLFGFFSRSKS